VTGLVDHEAEPSDSFVCGVVGRTLNGSAGVVAADVAVICTTPGASRR